MKILAHISDLHFGTEDRAIADGLRGELLEKKPNLVIVTGDLTQRARRNQFLAAENFLGGLPFPRLVVPGNHDIPLFDLFRRLFSPLGRYRGIVTEDLNPFYGNDEIAVCGINTARRSTWKEGRISLVQMEEIRSKLCSLPNSLIKIVVTHHPFIPPPEDDGIKLVGRSVRALTVLEECGVELLLSGHLHHGYSGDVRPYYPRTRRSILVVQAGTAMSRRTRTDPNAYNLISVARDEIDIRVRQWNGREFAEAFAIPYIKKNGEWQRKV